MYKILETAMKIFLTLVLSFALLVGIAVFLYFAMLYFGIDVLEYY